MTAPGYAAKPVCPEGFELWCAGMVTPKGAAQFANVIQVTAG
jgi:hypothetical protein